MPVEKQQLGNNVFEVMSELFGVFQPHLSLPSLTSK
jgi:hypothetical protein